MRSSIVRTVQKEVGTAFYREYLRRMLDEVPYLLEIIKSDEESAPDILSVSSKVLISIFQENHQGQLPQYIRALSLDDYFSERVTGSFAIKTIVNAWKTSPGSFEIIPRSNELRYNAGSTWDVDRILKELPETLEPHKSRDWLVMNLDTAEEYFGLSFRFTFWESIRKRFKY